MTNRRPPPPTSGDPTALFDRPTFGDENGDDDRGDEQDGSDGASASPFDAEGGARPDAGGFDDDDELTDPGLVPAHLVDDPAPTRAQAPTLRLSLDDLDDLDDTDALAISLPDAHVEEHEVSDLDGDVAASGAPTAIMQLPPEMLAHHVATDGAPPPSDDDSDGAEPVVAFRRWSAGGAASTPAPASLPSTPAAPPAATPPSPPVLAGVPRSPAAAPPVGPAAFSAGTAPTLPRAATVTSTPAAVKRLVDDALKAVTAAQTCLDDGTPASAERAHAQLARAVAVLVRLGEEVG